MSLSVGDQAPDFELDGVDGRTGDPLRVRLSDLRGETVVLVFYPADNTPVCTKQLISYTEGIAGFDQLGATVLAISPQDPESHRRFAANHDGFAFPLLSDLDKAVARSYDIVGLLDLYRRSTFVIGPDGIVSFAHRYLGPGLAYKTVHQITAAIEGRTEHDLADAALSEDEFAAQAEQN